MLHRILVPLDGSAFAETVLPTARRLARRHGSRIDLVRVHQPPLPLSGASGPGMYDPTLDHELDREGRRYLDAVRARIAADSTPVVTYYLRGPVAERLSRYIQDQAIDLTVMATHARRGVSRAWLGSVADGLVRHSSAPVLLLRPEHAPQRATDAAPVFRRALLPLDGGSAEDRMIEHALTVAGTQGVEYTLLRVVMSGAPSGHPPRPRRGEDPGSRLQRETVQVALGVKAEPLRARRIAVRPQVVVNDDPAEAILRYAAANDVDLVSMATRSRGGLERLLLGSVADRVLRKAEIALLLWNPGQALSLDPTGASVFRGGGGEPAPA